MPVADEAKLYSSERGCTGLRWTRTLTMVALFGNMGMFLAGYTSAVQNNAMLPLAEDFNLTTGQKEWGARGRTPSRAPKSLGL